MTTLTLEHEPVSTAISPIPADSAAETDGDDLSTQDNGGITWRDIDEIRHANYLALRAKYRADEGPNLPDRGALQRFSDYVGVASRYVGHLERKKKRIGRKMANRFEEVFNLEPGWMDVDRRDATIPMDPDAREFAELAMRLYLHDRNGVKSALLRYMEDAILHPPRK